MSARDNENFELEDFTYEGIDDYIVFDIKTGFPERRSNCIPYKGGYIRAELKDENPDTAAERYPQD